MPSGRLRTRIARFLQRPGSADLGRYRGVVAAAGAREPAVERLTDEELTAAAARLRRTGGTFGETELAEVCALGREVARRTLGERPFDVQLLGTLGLLGGYVVEMATGEGKTLSGAVAAAGFALQGRRVHVISVNDYLARRDATWMGPLYERLGISVAWVNQDSTWAQRRQAYGADVTYVPVSEAGFDVLRDRLCTDPDDRVLPAPDVALVDEADSVMVDEARVPLVLAGTATEGAGDPEVAGIVRSLRARLHYEIDEDHRNVHLTEAGVARVEQRLGGVELYAAEHAHTLTQVNVALYAHVLLRRDVDYLVRDGKVHLISASRGRVARLQRWPDGLQAAVEAKEGLTASGGGEPLDWVIVQALIGRYPSVAGMTGTAVAVSRQLREFFGLEVGVVPTNRPCIRTDEPDRLYATLAAKEAALVEYVAAAHATGRPVLVGTLDVAESERLAAKLARAGVPCTVLNARNDADEAAVVAQAGTHGAVTISTQMAGRGTDIRLGGADGADHERVAALGGLAVVGSGRYPTSRLDDQLRGRAGRQGDPGGSVFFTSMEDELVTRGAPDAAPAGPAGPDGRLDDRQAQRTVEHAQRVAEGADLDSHRTTWRYNQLLHIQRVALLEEREHVLTTDLALRELAERCPERLEELRADVEEAVLLRAARLITLYHMDRCWTEYLAFLNDLREGIHLRALGREDPLHAFHREAAAAFKELAEDVRTRAAKTFQTAGITADGLDLAAEGLQRPSATWTYMVHDNPFGSPEDRFLRFVGSAIRQAAAGPRPRR